MLTPKQIAKIRTDLGLSQVQFATYMQVSMITVTNWENGVRNPDNYKLATLIELRRQIDEARANKAKEEFITGLKLAGAVGISALLAYIFSDNPNKQTNESKSNKRSTAR